jgi:tRNA(His) 5'-end guanylyltransferase
MVLNMSKAEIILILDFSDRSKTVWPPMSQLHGRTVLKIKRLFKSVFDNFFLNIYFYLERY